MTALLSVRDLAVSFATDEGTLRAVDGISFDVDAGEVFAIVGESGSGKSAAALSVLGLLPRTARVDRGEIWWREHNLLQADDAALRAVRGREIAMVFQDPLTALNPVHRVGRQVAEVLRVQHGQSRKSAQARAVELLELVGIPEPGRRARAYPHELSGGMRQRVMIAMALAGEPALLIADEPTTALDVTVQAQLLELLDQLRRDIGIAVLLITHDLGVVASAADRVLVMYAGRIVEQGTVDEVFTTSAHPYTRALLESLPSLDHDPAQPLRAIAGSPPTPLKLPSGCAFHPRCPHAREEPCQRVVPKPVAIAFGPGAAERHVSACHLIDELDLTSSRGRQS